jgi:colanic acid biosynthesis glycosyl transferase WcaI
LIDLNIFKPISKWNAIQKLPRDLQGKLYRKFIVLYAGIMGYFQDPEIVLKLAQLITDEDILFVLIGTGPLKEQLAKEREKQNLDNILLLDPVPHELMPFIYNVADLTLLPPPVSYDSRMYKYFVVTLPKKFIEYAACGKPILCITPPCVASNLCLKWKAGYHIEPDNVENVINIIKTLKENKTLRETLGENARKMAEKLFSVEQAVETLSQIIEAL